MSVWLAAPRKIDPVRSPQFCMLSHWNWPRIDHSLKQVEKISLHWDAWICSMSQCMPGWIAILHGHTISSPVIWYVLFNMTWNENLGCSGMHSFALLWRLMQAPAWGLDLPRQCFPSKTNILRSNLQSHLACPVPQSSLCHSPLHVTGSRAWYDIATSPHSSVPTTLRKLEATVEQQGASEGEYSSVEEMVLCKISMTDLDEYALAVPSLWNWTFAHRYKDLHTSITFGIWGKLPEPVDSMYPFYLCEVPPLR